MGGGGGGGGGVRTDRTSCLWHYNSYIPYLTLLVRLLSSAYYLSNSLNSDQEKGGPDLDPNCLTLMVFLKEFYEKVNFEKSQQTMKNYSAYSVKGKFHIQQINDVFITKS